MTESTDCEQVLGTKLGVGIEPFVGSRAAAAESIFSLASKARPAQKTIFRASIHGKRNALHSGNLRIVFHEIERLITCDN